MKKILLCTDGSVYSVAGAESAAWLASRLPGLEIEILYVSDLRQFEAPLIADISGSLGIQPYQGIMGQLHEFEENKARYILETSEQILLSKGIAQEKIRVYHRTGMLVDVLREFEGHCDLVVIGKRGENADFAKGHLGSTVERAVRGSDLPFFVNARKYRDIKQAVLAFDNGESCWRALHFICHSPFLKDCKVHLLNVPEEGEEGHAAEAIKKAEKALTEAGFQDTVTQMLPGLPENVVGKYVEDQGIDLLVMGAYGHSRIRSYVIGSTTTEMMRACRIPVLCFR